MLKNVITFDSSAKKEILDFFDKTTDSEDFIVEKNEPTQRVLTVDGDEVNIKKFAGLKKGSEIFIKSDLLSLMDLADKMK